MNNPLVLVVEDDLPVRSILGFLFHILIEQRLVQPGLKGNAVPRGNPVQRLALDLPVQLVEYADHRDQRQERRRG